MGEGREVNLRECWGGDARSPVTSCSARHFREEAWKLAA